MRLASADSTSSDASGCLRRNDTNSGRSSTSASTSVSATAVVERLPPSSSESSPHSSPGSSTSSTSFSPLSSMTLSSILPVANDVTDAALVALVEDLLPGLERHLVHELGDGGALAVVHRHEQRDVLQKRGIGGHGRMLAWI